MAYGGNFSKVLMLLSQVCNKDHCTPVLKLCYTSCDADFGVVVDCTNGVVGNIQGILHNLSQGLKILWCILGRRNHTNKFVHSMEQVRLFFASSPIK